MTTELKLLTEADIDRFRTMSQEAVTAELRERGLIAEEPVDPLLVEAQEICAEWCEGWDATDCARRYRTGEWDDTPHVAIALAALRRGMELASRKELTREELNRVYEDAVRLSRPGQFMEKFHALLTEALQ